MVVSKEIAVAKEEILEAIAQMSVMDLNDLVKAFEEKFEVSAAAMSAAPIAGIAAAIEEQTEFCVHLLPCDATKKISIIKVVREITALGLKEAKELVEAAPKVIKEAIPKAQAEEIKKKLEDAGAKVEVK